MEEGNIDFLFTPSLRGCLSLFNPPFLYSEGICGISCQPARPVLQRLMHHCQNDFDQKEGEERGEKARGESGSRVWFDRCDATLPPLDMLPVRASASVIHQPLLLINNMIGGILRDI